VLVLDWNRRGRTVVSKWRRGGVALDLDWTGEEWQWFKRRGAALVLEVFFVLYILGQSLTRYYI